MLQHPWILIAVVALPAADAAAKCARTEQRPVVLTTRDTKLPDDGGILVGWQTETYSDANDHVPYDKDPTDQPTWTAQDGANKPVALTRTALAPGLSVYVPAKGTGAVILTAKAKQPLGKFTHDPKAAKVALPAPQVASLALVSTQEMRWRERRATATLAAPPPEAAVAIIVYRAGKPLTFARLPDTHDHLTELETFQDAGHCGSVVFGSEPPAANDKVTFAWVDAFGRLSPQSAAIAAHAK